MRKEANITKFLYWAKTLKAKEVVVLPITEKLEPSLATVSPEDNTATHLLCIFIKATDKLLTFKDVDKVDNTYCIERDDDRVHQIHQYPENSPALAKNAVVAALYPKSPTEWTSVFYEGRVTKPFKFVGKGKEMVSIRFTGEPEVLHLVPRENIIFFR